MSATRFEAASLSCEEKIARLEEQLAQAQKLTALGELLGTTTHEFNNVLMTILNYARMGMRHKDEPTRDKAFDGLTNTYFDAPTGNGNWVGLDLGTARQVTTIRYFPRVNWVQRMVGGKFQASNSPTFTSGVVDLHTITTTPPLAWTEVTVSVPGTFRYVRYLGPNGSYGNVAEIEFLGPAT